jgi:CRP-like cAMP-binding protein
LVQLPARTTALVPNPADAVQTDPSPPRRATAPALPLTRLIAPLLLVAACLLLLQGTQRLPGLQADLASHPFWRALALSLVSAAGLWLFIRLVDTLLWDRLLPRTAGVRFPKLLRQVVAVVFCIIGVAFVLSQVWQVSVGPVLATTGAIGIVAGLALRNVLADFFSGIALNMEHPFRLDDFVLFHIRGKREPVAGFVREINWRSTTVLTPEDNLISVPNSLVAASTVENLSFPSPVYELELDIVLDWHLDPAVLEPVLSAAMVDAWVRGATSGDKPPKFRICRLDGAGVTYRIVYLIDPRKKPKGPARHTLLSCLQQHLRCAGLRPVVAEAGSSGTPPPPQRALDHVRVEDRQGAVDHVPLLGVLTAAERQRLAAATQLWRVATGTAVVKAGDAGSSMFIVAAGVLEVLVPGAGGGAAQRVGTLSPGGFFGEMSLLTGEPRTATVSTLCASVLYEVPQAVMAELLAERPALAESLSAVMAEHLRRDQQASDATALSEAPRRLSLAATMADRIRRYLAR